MPIHRSHPTCIICWWLSWTFGKRIMTMADDEWLSEGDDNSPKPVILKEKYSYFLVIMSEQCLASDTYYFHLYWFITYQTFGDYSTDPSVVVFSLHLCVCFWLRDFLQNHQVHIFDLWSVSTELVSCTFYWLQIKAGHECLGFFTLYLLWHYSWYSHILCGRKKHCYHGEL